MRQVQKRYLYSALFSSCFFILIYLILDFNIFISLIFTIIMYFGGIFLFKEKDIRLFTPEHVNNYYFIASKVLNRSNSLDNEKMKENVKKITDYTDKILVSLEQRPKKVEQVFDFFDYYLDITNKIINRNILLKNKTQLKSDEETFLKNSETYIKAILDTFKKQYKNMQEAKMIDIKNEIEIFQNKVGLKSEDLIGGEEDGQ